MKTTYCNPLDLSYRYQHFFEEGRRFSCREGADPTMILFKGTYYLFVSMSAGFWYSSDLLNWQFHSNPELLIYDYAPDVRQLGDYLYFCASRSESDCPILRSADPLKDDFTEVSAPFPFWDPDIFQDDDGRVYLYWGCTCTDPIYGIELDRETMLPIGEKKPLIFGREQELGYERPGENGSFNKEDSPVYQNMKALFNPETGKIEPPPGIPLGGFDVDALTQMFLSVGRPYMEGPFMTKHGGKYYLQYACPGTEFNVYADGVYVSDHPLGPFALQDSNPFSSKSGGFITGAGHGSTIQDQHGNYWHASTMRISVNHRFERRVGLFPAGIDKDGTLFCNQNFADYPIRIPDGKFDPESIGPEWMLLSYGKPVLASSAAPGRESALAVDEDIRTWWSAATADSGEWLCVDLERPQDVRAIQVNLADEGVSVELSLESYGGEQHNRCIELKPQISHYTIETSLDGLQWTELEEVARECSNGYFEYPEGIAARYVRVTGGQLPYGQALRISGLRVFGNGGGDKPAKADATAERLGDLDALVRWKPLKNAQGCNVRYGIAPDKLYQSWLVYGENEVKLTTLIKGKSYFIRVDSFNENGITPGDVFRLS